MTSVITYVSQDTKGKVKPHRFRFDYRHISRLELEDAARDARLSIVQETNTFHKWGHSFIVAGRR